MRVKRVTVVENGVQLFGCSKCRKVLGRDKFWPKDHSKRPAHYCKICNCQCGIKNQQRAPSESEIINDSYLADLEEFQGFVRANGVDFKVALSEAMSDWLTKRGYVNDSI